MSLNSLLRSLGISLFLFFISSFSSNLFAQNCNIEITIKGRAEKWGDRVFFKLIDGSNNTVLRDGGYGKGVFTNTYNCDGANPPYTFKIDIINDVYQDNAVDYSIKVGVVNDISGTLSSVKIGTNTYPKSINTTLNNTFDGCSTGMGTPCPNEISWNFFSQEDLDDFKKAYGNCTNIVLKNIYIGQNYDGFNQSQLSASHTSDIIDLSALYNITQITGDLVIENNLRLTNMNGLMNLVEIGGNNLKIKRNSLLTYCNNIAIKNYLAKSATTFKREITGNLQNCLNEAAVKNANNNTCPSGSFNFTTQKQIDDFGGLYSNCQTYSIADMTINGVDIKDLRPLQKIKSLTGNLIIQNNTILESLTGLENLTAVNGYISVATNAQLKDISALKNISASSIEKLDIGLNIQGNPVLNVCNLPNFCAYLSNPSNPKTISGNAAVCVNEQAFLNTCNTLPVNLLSYNATTTNTAVKLQWQTSFELNNKKFEIYRSGDDQQFIKIGEIKGLNTKGYYLFSDPQPLNGNNYYKLMQLDTDGKESNLGLRYINFSVVKKHIQVFPNPTTNKVTISFRPSIYQALQLVDLNGKTISTIQIHKQDNQKEISLENYPAGVYLLRLIGNDASETMKVTENP